jgi:hypothetical protein
MYEATLIIVSTKKLERKRTYSSATSAAQQVSEGSRSIEYVTKYQDFCQSAKSSSIMESKSRIGSPGFRVRAGPIRMIKNTTSARAEGAAPGPSQGDRHSGEKSLNR